MYIHVANTNMHFLLIVVTIVKHERVSMVVWGAKFWGCLGPLVVQREYITGVHYDTIISNHFHSKLQILFPGEHFVFKVTISASTQLAVFKHAYISMMMEWNVSCSPLSPVLNTIGPVCCARIPIPSTIPEHEIALHEEGCKFI